MVKLSEKFKNNRILISIISIIIIIIGILLFFTQYTNYKIAAKKMIQNSEETSKKYEYKAFKPTFKKTSDSPNDDYDFTQDMIYKDNIYYKKINNYDEYSEVKARWNNILDMNKEDFQNSFMVITAVENTSMVGLTLDKIDTDNSGLYISLIHYQEGTNYNENETCISIKIQRDLERENIYVTRNLRNNEKDMSEEMRLAEKNTLVENLASFQYKDETYRKAEKNDNRSTSRLIQPDWQDMIFKKFTITKNMPEIDVSNWTNLGNDFYSISITNYSDYLKLINNYNAPKLTWYDFKNIYAIVIVRKSADNSIEVKNIENENGKSYLSVSIGGWFDVTDEFKYPAICTFVPNYRSLGSNFLSVRENSDDENTEVINDTVIQGIVELKQDKYIYMFNGQHFGEFGFEMKEYTSASINNSNQTCIDYLTLNKYDTNYIEEGDLLICTGNLNKKGYGMENNFFDTKNNSIVVLKSSDYNKMKREALMGKRNYSSIVTIGDEYVDSGYVYLKYSLEDDTHSDTSYNLPFVVKAYIDTDTKVVGNIERGKKVKVVYKDVNADFDKMKLQSIEIL